MYYADFFLIGQIIEAINPPENVSNYVCKDREVMLFKPRFDVSTNSS